MRTINSIIAEVKSMDREEKPHKDGKSKDNVRRIIHTDWKHKRLMNAHEAFYQASLKYHKLRFINEKRGSLKKNRDKVTALIRRLEEGQSTKNAINNNLPKKIKTKLSKELIEGGLDLDTEAGKQHAIETLSKVVQDYDREIRRKNRETDLGNFGDETNFLLADIEIMLTTKNENGVIQKRLPVTIPIQLKQPIFDYNSIKESGAAFKSFFRQTYQRSKTILGGSDIQLKGSGSNFSVDKYKEKYYLQKAHHSEKFLYFALIEGGLKKIIATDFPQVGINPRYVHSIDRLTIDIHSTRAMCETCEPVTIGFLEQIKDEFLERIKEHGFPESNIEVFVNIVYKIKKRGKSDTCSNYGIQETKDLELDKISDKKSRLHSYTLFCSGGQSKNNTGVTKRNTHRSAFEEVNQNDRKTLAGEEQKAAVKIQALFKGYKVRKQLENFETNSTLLKST